MRKFEYNVDVSSGEQKFGIIGTNLSHSLSPSLHAFSAKQLGLNLRYDAYELTIGGLQAFLDSFYAQGGCGLNVTFPFKELVAKKVNAAIESVNTLVRQDVGWDGFSTDGLGFERALAHMGQGLERFEHLVLLGNGGAAKAIARQAVNAGVYRLTVVRRSALRDVEWRAHFAANVVLDFLPFADVDLLARTLKASATILVQATSGPVLGDDLHQLVPAIHGFDGVFIDLAYGRVSSLFKAAMQRGLICQDGLPMLIEQARASQEIWWGQSAPYKSIEEHLLTMLSGQFTTSDQPVGRQP